eukprot:scaffold106939_cov23-Cyclotella_meneghiniana.AAC.1
MSKEEGSAEQGGNAAMEDTQQPDSDPCRDDHVPNHKKKKMPQRRRKFTKTIDPRAKKKSVPPAKSNISADLEASASVRSIVSYRGAKRKMSNSVLENNLKHSYQKLDDAQSSLVARDKTIESLTKKNKELSDTVKITREASRQTKTVAADSVKVLKGQMKETRAAASNTIKSAKFEVKKSQDAIQNLRASLAERDSLIMNLKKQHEIELAARESAAIEKERDRSSRALLVAQKKSEAKLSALEKSHSIEIESKSKEIKVESNC